MKKPISFSRSINRLRFYTLFSVLICLVLSSTSLNAEGAQAPKLPSIDREHAARFSTIILQDFQGRMKPVHTLASEVLRKLSRKNELYGMNPSQVIISMSIFPEVWRQVPLIRLGRNPKIKELVGVKEGLASYADFFNNEGKFKLTKVLRQAHSTEKQYRGTFEKELIKLDERINIANMIFSHRMMRIFPVEGSPNQKWHSTYEAMKTAEDTETFENKFYPVYRKVVTEASSNGDWSTADAVVEELRNFQKNNGGDLLPSPNKIKAEILLNNSHVFDRLMKFYALLGLIVLLLFFIEVFHPNKSYQKAEKIVFAFALLGFVFHTFGLGLRWYVSGRAPWSNGYESMIYIAFTTMLAGVLIARRSLGSLAAALILSSTILMVAGLSNYDPEITPLVPVLKSYWLTIHVSMEAGSYGFLLLGAIIGLINLILMIGMNEKNKERVLKSIRKLSAISEMSIIGGLVMVSIGTYLGGVWANESWGRYWGWDPKETWALVTVLVYAFIIHMRFIPGVRGLFAFNFSTLFGFATVLMTYLGVNYYLSGLHSYASGDPAPIPPSVYYTAFFFGVISLMAYWRYHKVVK